MTEEKENKIRQLISCPRCNHSWLCSSTRQWVTCPNCLKKNKMYEEVYE